MTSRVFRLLSKSRVKRMLLALSAQDEAFPKDYDLCVKVNRTYVDVVNLTPSDWHILAADEVVKRDLPSRTKAIRWIAKEAL